MVLGVRSLWRTSPSSLLPTFRKREVAERRGKCRPHHQALERILRRRNHPTPHTLEAQTPTKTRVDDSGTGDTPGSVTFTFAEKCWISSIPVFIPIASTVPSIMFFPTS